jgi:hypothetical protein
MLGTTYKSPASLLGMPLPLSRILRPVAVPAGIVNSRVEPAGVGILTAVPSAASQGASGKSR